MSKMFKIITKDEKQYKIDLELLKRYSNFFNMMIEEQYEEEGSMKLEHFSSQAFDYIYEFIQLHKTNVPRKIERPVIKEIELNMIMSEQDAELVERIRQLSNGIKNQILNGVIYFQIQQFKKMLIYAFMQSELSNQKERSSRNQVVQKQIHEQIERRIRNFNQMYNINEKFEGKDENVDDKFCN